jgi:hypothetical protein
MQVLDDLDAVCAERDTISRSIWQFADDPPASL